MKSYHRRGRWWQCISSQINPCAGRYGIQVRPISHVGTLHCIPGPNFPTPCCWERSTLWAFFNTLLGEYELRINAHLSHITLICMGLFSILKYLTSHNLHYNGREGGGNPFADNSHLLLKMRHSKTLNVVPPPLSYYDSKTCPASQVQQNASSVRMISFHHTQREISKFTARFPHREEEA